MLTHLSLNSFKNHASGHFLWDAHNLITGSNGSGKTNLLEAIYLLVNGMPVSGKTMTQSVRDGVSVFSLAGGIMKGGFQYECRLGCDTVEKQVSFSFQQKESKRSAYLESMPDRAVFFSPIEMNILYLGPSLRRDLLDESIALADTTFIRVRRDYATALRNRNALLKSIRERRATSKELDTWDHLFAEHAIRYYEYRMRFVRFVRENADSIRTLLGGKYDIRFDYISRVSPEWDTLHAEIIDILRHEREHEIASGHTSIGPHLDDFAFIVRREDGWEHRSHEYLSRGENKTVLLGLKFLALRFIESSGDKKTLLLFDDLFSELDAEHTDLVLREAGDRQIFVTSQNPGGLYPFCADFRVVELD